MTDPTVLTEKREGYRVLTLNRPDRLNAISLSLLEDMNAALDDQVERLAVKNVGGVNDRRRLGGWLEAGGKGALDFASADGIYEGPRVAHHVEDGET